MSMFPTGIQVELVPKNDKNILIIEEIEFPVNKGIIYLFPHIREVDRSKIDFNNYIQWRRENSVHFKVTQGEQFYKWVNFLVSHTL